MAAEISPEVATILSMAVGRELQACDVGFGINRWGQMGACGHMGQRSDRTGVKSCRGTAIDGKLLEMFLK